MSLALFPPAPWAWAVLLPLALGLAAWVLRVVRRSAFLAGVPLGILVLRLGGFGGFSLLAAFFLLGTALTRLGYTVKEARGVAEEQGGRRGASHVAANCGAGLLLLVLRAVLAAAGAWPAAAGRPAEPVVFWAALAGSFAAALSDTASSEIGQLWGRRTVLLPSFRPVPVGTQGAVSLEGLGAGLGAAAIVAALALALALVDARGAVAVALAGFLGNLLESLAGSGGRRLLPHGLLNFTNTVVGAALAAAGAALLR
jgi:uncharacterized protein (TIGR00297 family)